MAKPNDKHAKELKRLAKKKAAAKAAAGDPWAGVPADDGQLTCIINGELHLDGQCGILVLRSLSGNVHSLASFLIDRGVVGLKDAWGYAKSSRAEFNEMLAEFREDGLTVAPITPAAARALIAGAARYADEYGFKLPKDWLRWAGMLGGVGDWHTADTDPFRPEYAETIAYAKRLIGSTPGAFFARPDITFLFPESEGEPPADPDAQPTVLTGETLHATPPDAWVEPTRDDYAKVVALFDRRRRSIVVDSRATMAELAFTPGANLEEDAVAARAAMACIARFGRPPASLISAIALPTGVDPAMADAFYFFTRILAELFDRRADTEAIQVMTADCVAIAKLEARSQRRQLADPGAPPPSPGHHS